MPKITTTRRDLEKLLGKARDPEAFRRDLLKVKGELDDWGDAPEGSDCEVKVELNDTNRPDTWTPEGIARQLKGCWGEGYPSYDFLTQDPIGEVHVDPKLETIRPYIGAFVAKGPAVDDSMLRSLIQTQEKLSDTFGRKRKDIAAGIYKLNLVKLPVSYGVIAPDAEGFVPLGETKTMTPKEILENHPKGQEYAVCLKDFSQYPILKGDDGRVLSMPPIINSADLGAVEVGDSELFVEFTGTSLEVMNVAVSVMAADMADRGFTISRVETVYPYETPWGSKVRFPHHPKCQVSSTLAEINKSLGIELSIAEAKDLLERYGLTVEQEGDTMNVIAPFYRNDLLHPMDVVEDVAICRGYDSFPRIMPSDFTVGRLSDVELSSGRFRERMVGLGFQELSTPVLTHGNNLTEKMTRDGADLVEILNPMSENYGVVRNSLLPTLLEVEERSHRSAFPHRTFECGEIARKAPDNVMGTETRRFLSALVTHAEAGFAEVHAQLDSLLTGLGYSYRLEAKDLDGYLGGRSGEVFVNEQKIGSIGEIHPQVLEHWGVKFPSAGFELDIECLS